MEKTIIKPQNVCSREIQVEHENGVIQSVRFIGGCPGNTQGLAILLKGRKIEDIIPLLENVKCPGSRTRDTSCPAQLALGLKSALK